MKKNFWLFLVYFSLCVLGTGVGVEVYRDIYLKMQNIEHLVVTRPEIKEVSVEEKPFFDNRPVYCVQVPNGMDGARPQAGLTHAKVVFEAIAESQITRFAAIFQGAETGVIGPLRSLRSYYLEWDTPFDCTIVHAGGSGDALENLKIFGHKDLTENYAYMWRGAATYRAWNNLFTNVGYFDKFAEDSGYTSSNPRDFARIKESEAEKTRIYALAKNPLKIDKETSEVTKTLTPSVSEINIYMTGYMNYNPQFRYNIETNSYDRFYEGGEAHDVYDCQTGGEEVTPELSCGETKQLSPKVVVAMFVEESLAADFYHEDIASSGSGRAVVFMNGGTIEGTWSKPTRDDQIVFTDGNGKNIELMPGQTWVVAVPNYRDIEYK